MLIKGQRPLLRDIVASSGQPPVSADLSQRPGGSGDRPGNEDGDIQNWKFVCPVFGQ